MIRLPCSQPGVGQRNRPREAPDLAKARAATQVNPNQPRYAGPRAAKLSEMMKPTTGGEAADVCSRRALRGQRGRRVPTDESRNLRGPTRRGRAPTAERESITAVRAWSGIGRAHSSDDAG